MLARRRRVVLFSVLCISLAFVLAQHLFHQSFGDVLIDNDQPAPSPLIVVLGGDFYGARVDRAAELVTAGYAPAVLISGPPYGTPPRPEGEWAIEYLEKKGYRRGQFLSFGHTAQSTPDEVVELCRELNRRQTRSILLVTDGYHSRRSALTFAVICPEVRVRSVPANDGKFNPHEWWTRDKDTALVKSEWKKMIGTVALAPWYWFRRAASR